MKRTLVTATLLTGLLCTATAGANPTYKDRMAARKLVQEGKLLAKQGKHDEAAKKLAKADKLVPTPSTKLELAKAYLEQGDLVGASDTLDACMEQESVRQWPEKTAQKKCITLASKVDDRMPRITVVVQEPSSEDVTIQIDGDDYDPSDGEVGYNPGKYKITAEADGYESFKKTVKLAEGDRETIEISLKLAKVEKKDDEGEEESDGISPIPAYVAWGVGAVGLGLGIGFGIAAIQTTNQVFEDYDCSVDDPCPRASREDLDIAKLNGTISTVGFLGIAPAGLIAGTILYLFADTGGEDDREDSGDIEVEPLIGPGYIGVTGAF